MSTLLGEPANQGRATPDLDDQGMWPALDPCSLLSEGQAHL